MFSLDARTCQLISIIASTHLGEGGELGAAARELRNLLGRHFVEPASDVPHGTESTAIEVEENGDV